MQLPKLGMGDRKLRCVHIRTQKILHTSIRFLWLTSFFSTSKNLRWSNNNCCSKVKLFWKLIFPGHFVTLLEIRFNLSKQQDVKSTDRFPDLCNRMIFQQLVWVTGYTKIPYGLNFPSTQKIKISKFAQANFPNLAAVKLHRKTIDSQCFLKLATTQNQHMKIKQKMTIIGVL